MDHSAPTVVAGEAVICFYADVETRITVDLRDPQLVKLLRLEAAQEGKTLREVIVAALESYFSAKRENQAVMKLAERVFSEWDNPKDSEYDRV